MKKIYFLIVLAITLLIGAIASVSFVTEVCKSLEEENSYYIWLPESVSTFFKNERIILEFRIIGEGTLVINGFVTNNKISNLQCGNAGQYSYWVTMSGMNALDLATSDTPITTFVTLWNRGEIQVRSKNIELEQKLNKGKRLLLPHDTEPVPREIQEEIGKIKEEYRKR